MNGTIEIDLFDTTLRDGAQSLPEDHQFDYGAKTEIADRIAQLGIGIIEAGFPNTPGDGEEVAAVAKTIGVQEYLVDTWVNGTYSNTEVHTPVIAGLCRTKTEDIDATWEAVHSAKFPRIHTFISTDPEHMAAKFPDKSPLQVLAMGRSAVLYSKEIAKEHSRATVEFSAEAASTTDLEYLENVIKTMVNAGADVINVPDTVGQKSPFEMVKFYKNIITWIMHTNPEVTLSAHNHNDLGMATANSAALVLAASEHAHEHDARIKLQIETTICGLGERAGNTDIFPFIASLFKETESIDIPVTWKFNREQSFRVAAEVLGFAGLTVDRQNPIVGNDVNVHRSGIHSDGVIKGGHSIYSPFNPAQWGHKESARHEDGRYQGRAGKAAIHAE